MTTLHTKSSSTSKPSPIFIRALLAIALIWLSVLSQASANITTQYATMARQNDGAYALNSYFRINLPNQLKDAINHGTPIYFTLDFTLSRPRWYWSAEDVVTTQREYRISYNSLTQQYRVAVGENQHRFRTLNESILFTSNPNQWRTLEKNKYSIGEPYDVRVRMELNTNKLPQTYQLNSLTNQGWGLSSGWYSFTFTPR